jgi:PncC family amidohydrolase
LTPETQVIEQLGTSGRSLGVAESCTGGLLAGRLTMVPGASAVFLGGVVAYANEVKQRLLGVQEETLARYGAVSEQTAMEMAAGAREALGVDYAVSVTGIAGPGGGTEEKPVGLVYIAALGPEGGRVTRWVFAGDREAVRAQSVDAALNLLLELIDG